MINNVKTSFVSGLDDEEDFSGPPALETIEVQQQQVSNYLINKQNYWKEKSKCSKKTISNSCWFCVW